jgi:hypothetical protein
VPPRRFTRMSPVMFDRRPRTFATTPARLHGDDCEQVVPEPLGLANNVRQGKGREPHTLSAVIPCVTSSVADRAAWPMIRTHRERESLSYPPPLIAAHCVKAHIYFYHSRPQRTPVEDHRGTGAT